MSMLSKVIGPKSKRNIALPFTYEARVPIVTGQGLYNYYMSDTICGLIEYLEKAEITPAGVEISEVYQDGENIIPQVFYTTEAGDWLHKPQICRCFSDHYEGHISDGSCSFRDRDRDGIGP